jgi:hypothetical protein
MVSPSDTRRRYVPNPEHRDATRAKKSQWRISGAQEEQCFRRSEDAGWLDGGAGWGFHGSPGSPAPLGVGIIRTESLCLAKFVQPRNVQTWHGWPAQPDRFPADMPTAPIRTEWLRNPPMRLPRLRKLFRGQQWCP